MKSTNPAHQITTNRQSNAIGMAMVGLGSLVVFVSIWKWKVGPYMRKKRANQAEEFANIVFEKEELTKQETERNRFY
jgi:hypothetical protein